MKTCSQSYVSVGGIPQEGEIDTLGFEKSKWVEHGNETIT